jgi:hypothetical protein
MDQAQRQIEAQQRQIEMLQQQKQQQPQSQQEEHFQKLKKYGELRQQGIITIFSNALSSLLLIIIALSSTLNTLPDLQSIECEFSYLGVYQQFSEVSYSSCTQMSGC